MNKQIWYVYNYTHNLILDELNWVIISLLRFSYSTNYYEYNFGTRFRLFMVHVQLSFAWSHIQRDNRIVLKNCSDWKSSSLYWLIILIIAVFYWFDLISRHHCLTFTMCNSTRDMYHIIMWIYLSGYASGTRRDKIGHFWISARLKLKSKTYFFPQEVLIKPIYCLFIAYLSLSQFFRYRQKYNVFVTMWTETMIWLSYM